MRLINKIRDYLRDRQEPKTRILHLIIIFLVLSQIVVSNFIGINDDGEISKSFFEYYGTWVHIITGILVFPIVLIFLIIVIRNHSLKYFFPYLSGDYSQIKNDFLQLKQFKLPEPNASGIAASVQSLGLIALIMVLGSGFIWYLGWSNGVSWSNVPKEAHKLLTGLVITYVVGHGCMGILHIFYKSKD